MRVSVYFALAAGVLLCLVAPRVGRRLPPPLAATTLAGSSLLAAIAWGWNLALLAGPLVGSLSYVAALGHWSRPALAAHDPVPMVTASVAAILVVVAATGLVAACYRIGGELRRVSRAVAGCGPSTADRVVVVDDNAVGAMAVAGVRGRVLITTGMVRALDADERRVVLAHEHAHLRHAHAAYRLTVRLAAAVLPLLRPMIRECDYQLERWADEAAALAVGDRLLAARALGRAALARRRHPLPAGTLGFADRGVTDRVEALLAGPPEDRVLPLAVPVGLVLAITLATAEASRDLEALFELAKRLWTG